MAWCTNNLPISSGVFCFIILFIIIGDGKREVATIMPPSTVHAKLYSIASYNNVARVFEGSVCVCVFVVSYRSREK